MLFGKAWHATGHVSKEDALAAGGFSEQEWEECHLLPDPAELQIVLGSDNIDEPSVIDLIESGRSKRRRVLWQVTAKHPSEQFACLPAILIYPIEKRLCHWLFHTVSPNSTVAVKPRSTLFISRRNSKDPVGCCCVPITVLCFSSSASRAVDLCCCLRYCSRWRNPIL